MKKFLTIMLLGMFLSSGCGTEKPVSEPAPESPKASVVEQPAPQPVELANDLPAKISVMPSIGATRAECEKYYRQHVREGRYNNDELLITFLNDKDKRAEIFILQPEEGKTYNLHDYMPIDLQVLNVENKRWGDLTVKVIEGKSTLLEQVCPRSEGDFWAQLCWDRETNVFAGADFRIDFMHGK